MHDDLKRSEHVISWGEWRIDGVDMISDSAYTLPNTHKAYQTSLRKMKAKKVMMCSYDSERVCNDDVVHNVDKASSQSSVNDGPILIGLSDEEDDVPLRSLAKQTRSNALRKVHQSSN